MANARAAEPMPIPTEWKERLSLLAIATPIAATLLALARPLIRSAWSALVRLPIADDLRQARDLGPRVDALEDRDKALEKSLNEAAAACAEIPVLREMINGVKDTGEQTFNIVSDLLAEVRVLGKDVGEIRGRRKAERKE